MTLNPAPPARHFEQAEFEARTELAQRRRRDLKIDAMFVICENGAEMLSKRAPVEIPVNN